MRSELFPIAHMRHVTPPWRATGSENRRLSEPNPTHVTHGGARTWVAVIMSTVSGLSENRTSTKSGRLLRHAYSRGVSPFCERTNVHQRANPQG